MDLDTEELRRSILTDPAEPKSRLLRRRVPWQVPVLIVLTLLMVGPLPGWDSGEAPIKTAVAAETLERGSTQTADATATTVAAESTTSTTATTVAAEPTTSTTATTVPAVSPPPTTAAPPTTRPTTATTVTTRSTTTTTVSPAITAIQRQTSSQVFSGLQLTLTASPPWSGAVRTAGFQLTAEFGDTRVLRSVYIDFGDGAAADADMRAWDCWDPAAPNPHVVSGPSHTYAAAGTYRVVITVRTGLCAPGQDDPVAGNTAQLPLSLVVS
jgi:hypothetical protein